MSTPAAAPALAVADAGAGADRALAELTRLTLALADAIEGEDLEGAERLVRERDALIEAARPRARALAAAARATPALGAALAGADARARAGATARVAAIRAELAGLATGTDALRGYATAAGEGAGLAPGWVDRRG
jgi:hypothetical protein